MIVGRRSISSQGSRPPWQQGVFRTPGHSMVQRPARIPGRALNCRAYHEPSSPSHDKSPFDRVERHFDDRDRMFPAADLLRLVGRHKNDPGYKHLLPWMLRVETALEFMADLDIEALEGETEQERRTAVRGALKNAQGIRQLLDAFDPFLADEPELFEDTLLATDAAFDKRIHELAGLSRQSPRSAQPRQTLEGGLLTGFAQLWARLNEELERNVERREGPPAAQHHPLDFIRKHVDDQHR